MPQPTSPPHCLNCNKSYLLWMFNQNMNVVLQKGTAERLKTISLSKYLKLGNI